MAAKRRRRSEPFPIEKAIVVVLVVVAVGLAGWFVKDKLDHGPATARARRDWTAARTVVAARLKQDEPLEFGAVWATHAGVICGLVNGKASFGGLTGMTPFYIQGGRAVFPLDVTASQFAPGWRDCSRDAWVQILPGSMESGFCATKLGQLRC